MNSMEFIGDYIGFLYEFNGNYMGIYLDLTSTLRYLGLYEHGGPNMKEIPIYKWMMTGGTQKKGWFIMENPTNMDLEVPLLSETSTSEANLKNRL